MQNKIRGRRSYSLIANVSVSIAALLLTPNTPVAAYEDPTGLIRQGNKSSPPCVDGWHDGPTVSGVGGTVFAIAEDSAGNVFVAGDFVVAGRVVANHIAKWDGINWSSLGSGTNGFANAVAVSGSDVYVGGAFTVAGGIAANNIAQWNGTIWSPLGSGPGFSVNDMKISGAEIYVSGNTFDPSDGTSAGHVAKWNGSNWSTLGAEFDGYVDEISVSGTDVYAVGSFETVGETLAKHIAKWNGTGWSALGSGLNGVANAIAVSGTDVYAGGSFVSGGTAAGYVSKWNGTSWSMLGLGMKGPYVFSLAISGTDIYAGGRFDSASGTPANNIARWNGSSWSSPGSGLNGIVRTIAVTGTGILASNDGRTVRWNNSSWSSVDPTETESRVTDFAVSGADVFAAGYFTADGGSTYSGAAKWNGTGWTALGPGSWPNGPQGTRASVSSIAVSGSNVYVGGGWHDSLTFRAQGGFLFKWNGSGWSSLGSEMTGGIHGSWVSSIAVSGNDVYAGRRFDSTGGATLNSVARWNGSSWSEVGEWTGDYINDIASSGADLFVGDEYSSIVQKWNGSAWSSMNPWESELGSPPLDAATLQFNRPVNDIQVSGNDVYFATGMYGDYGGGFGVVLKWNGSKWTQTTNIGTYYALIAVGISGNDIYAGGGFVEATGGNTLHNIAKWNGSKWLPLGAGTNGPVDAIAISGSDVFVAGNFTTAGCHVSAYFARYSMAFVPEVSVSGRVTTPTGSGLRSAVVSLIDSLGNRRTVLTSSLGYYAFENVIPGKTYAIAVHSKRFRFESRSMMINDNLTEINFVGQE